MWIPFFPDSPLVCLPFRFFLFSSPFHSRFSLNIPSLPFPPHFFHPFNYPSFLTLSLPASFSSYIQVWVWKKFADQTPAKMMVSPPQSPPRSRRLWSYQLSPLINPRNGIMLQTELDDHCDKLQRSSVGARRYCQLSWSTTSYVDSTFRHRPITTKFSKSRV